MKKIYILMASAALVFAASCNTLEEVNTDSVVETELITVELNPDTKTALGVEGATTWSKGDEVSVTVNDKNIGSLKLVEGNIFSGEVEAGHNGDAILNYPAGVTAVPTTQVAIPGTFANGAALLEGTATMDELRAGKGAKLSNKTALLEFTVAQAGDVAFTLGSATYTVTGCAADEIYYVCVDPENSGKLSYTVAEKQGTKSKEGVKFEAGKIYGLGVLYSLAGDWNLVGAIGAVPMVKSDTYTELYVAKNVTLNSDNKFRFVNADQSKTVGAWGETGDVDTKDQINTWYGSDITESYAANIYVSTSAKYDVYFSPENNDFLIIKAGVEDIDSEWSMVGWIGNSDKWNYSNGIKLKYNYVLGSHNLTKDLTNGDYFLFVTKDWASWIGSPGNEWGDNGRNTTDYTIVNGATKEVNVHHSWGDEKAQFHMKNSGTYKIEIKIGNKYDSSPVKFTRIK